MGFDMRAQSGIDDILRDEGLDRDLEQLRAILRRPNVLDAFAIDVDAEMASGRPETPKRADGTVSAEDELVADDREYPSAGVDAFGAVPEDLDPYGAGAHVAAESGWVDAPEVARAGGVDRDQTGSRKSDNDQTQAKLQSAGRGDGGPPVSGTGTAR
jgi:sec-independent protein translocase protein TatB